ncbi:ArsR/SmtB family transcription factor [Kocuria sp.]|uniref:ArsR/SmtB family transcription factor n=1 Tax=Kocuria sp. TaxID=1871328 RepID=UPI0026E0C447|nr:metalloregulator ArsR/SmtB family transcription factor [Kocuria sp.]MDO5618546.1 metalloregulator ArsR/SmtB family transcription factor [Kocuria sp.]
MTQEIFAALAEPTRRAIVEALRHGELSVGELVDAVGASQPTVSKHLRILREAEVVAQRADGQRRYYTVEPTGLAPLTTWLEQFTSGVPAVPQETVQVDREVLDPLVVPQSEEQPQRGGILASVFRRRRR